MGDAIQPGNTCMDMEHHDLLEAACQKGTIADKLIEIHRLIKQSFSFIARIAVIVYDPQTDLLKTLAHSSDGDNPLFNYTAKLSEVGSLRQLLAKKQPRVINDMGAMRSGMQIHTRRIYAQGYGASYTIPLCVEDCFTGFLFFDSYQKHVFTEEVLRQLDLYGHVIGLMVGNQMNAVHTLVASIKSAANIVHQHDFETGSHLDRMSNYARVIASELAAKYQLSDEYIEDIFRFSPLHDVGKIGIPDSILMKPGRLNASEWAVMQTHTTKGGEIINDMLENFGLRGMPRVDMLRNIALYHHEKINGSGYPEGRKGNAIPLEAQIVAVADVFDALTSQRRYKRAWSNDEAFTALQRLSGEQFDQDCVMALIQCREEILAIQAKFRGAA